MGRGKKATQYQPTQVPVIAVLGIIMLLYYYVNLKMPPFGYGYPKFILLKISLLSVLVNSDKHSIVL